MLTGLDLGDNAKITNEGGKKISQLLDDVPHILRHPPPPLSFLEMDHNTTFRCVTTNTGIDDEKLKSRLTSQLERNVACGRVLDECLLQLKFASPFYHLFVILLIFV